MRITLLFILVLLFGALFVWADEPSEDSKEKKYNETVVVTADRIEESVQNVGSSVTVISREEIEQRRSPFVPDLLRSVPGVYISQLGSPGKIASIFTRGANSDQTLVLIDGVQINDSTGFADLSGLSTTNVERIEIVRGPQSTLYGSDAMGGVVNIITSSAGPLLSARGEFGSDSTGLGTVQGGFGSKENNAALEYSRFTTDGETKNDDYDNQTIGINLHTKVTDRTNLGFLYRKINADLGLPIYLGQPSLDQRQETDSTLFSIPLRQQILSNWDADAGFSVFDQELHYRNPSDPFGFTFSDTDSRITTFNFLNTIRIQSGHTVIAGYEYERIKMDDRNTFGVSLEDAEITNNAIYGQYQLSVLSPLTITIGLRVDDNSKFGTDANPRLAISYGATEALRIRGTAGTGFRAPRPFELGGFFGNSNLQPEEVTGWDLGADYTIVPGTLWVGATVFHNDFDNLIGFVASKYTNFKKATTSGLEFELGILPLKSLNIHGTYTLLNTEDEITREDLLRRPKNSGSVNVDYRWKRFGMNFNWNLIGKRFDINDAVFPSPRVIDDGYNRADVVISYNLAQGFQIYTRVINVFDQHYQEVFGFPSPDRGVFAGVNLGLR